jgi:tetratricopeptide (TPR) repeat protein
VLGWEYQLHFTKQDTDKAEEHFKKAIELDPQFARAYTGLAWEYCNQAIWGWREDTVAFLEKAKIAVRKAIELEPASAWAYTALGTIYMSLSDFDHGLAAFEQAYALNPNEPDLLAMYSGYLPLVGRAKEGVEMINRAFRLNPHPPTFYYLQIDPFYASGLYDQVVTMLHRFSGELLPWDWAVLAGSYAQLGRPSETARAVAELRRRYPDFSMERMFSDFGGIKDAATLAHYLEGARKAGLHECATAEELRKYPKITRLAYCDAKRATN